jgi:hypothetical protein
MLEAELRGEPYSKTNHRRKTGSRLDNRSDGSIEYKHQNISAVIRDLDLLPYITGYKPRGNYQGILRDATEEYITNHPALLVLAAEDANREVIAPATENILAAMVSPPREKAKPSESPMKRREIPIRRNFRVIEERNSSLGLQGEKFVVSYERARLIACDRLNLADRVEHSSQEQGDGLGFDIHSYESNGSDRFIEVKTTKYGSQTPFFITPNEIDFSSRKRDRYFLYRVFEFKRSPRMYNIRGSVVENFDLETTEFRASLKPSG